MTFVKTTLVKTTSIQSFIFRLHTTVNLNIMKENFLYYVTCLVFRHIFWLFGYWTIWIAHQLIWFNSKHWFNCQNLKSHNKKLLWLQKQTQILSQFKTIQEIKQLCVKSNCSWNRLTLFQVKYDDVSRFCPSPGYGDQRDHFVRTSNHSSRKGQYQFKLEEASSNSNSSNSNSRLALKLSYGLEYKVGIHSYIHSFGVVLFLPMNFCVEFIGTLKGIVFL